MKEVEHGHYIITKPTRTLSIITGKSEGVYPVLGEKFQRRVIMNSKREIENENVLIFDFNQDDLF